MRALPATALLGCLLGAVAWAPTLSAQPDPAEGTAPASSLIVDSSENSASCIPVDFLTSVPNFSRSTLPAPGLSTTASESLFSWPLGNALHDGLVLVNYVDDDPQPGSIRDYMGNRRSYDGHNGTDIVLLNFRQMDRGMPVLAAADGVVVAMIDGFADRNITNSSLYGNFVYLDHGNGLRSLYYHLRKWSTAVRLGEKVRRGQLLGLAGSSGSSTDAHLHFEINVSSGGVRDPWSGSFNTVPSLWREQEPYVGTVPARFYDMGIFGWGALNGNIGGLTLRALKERLRQPVVFGAAEGLLGVWVQPQGGGAIGATYRIEIRKPDQTPKFSVAAVSLSSGFLYGWQAWYWYLGSIPDSDLGTWHATVLIGGNVVKSLDFAVGRQTLYAPQFAPVAGKSFRLEGVTFQDQLRVDALSGPVNYSLLNAPPNVSLAEGGVVTITTPARPRNRSTTFQAVATNDAGLADTMWYHLVDLRAPAFVAEARAFLKDGHRTIPALVPETPASAHGAPVCVRIEPVDGSYSNEDVDLSSIRMISQGTGVTDAIAPLTVKEAAVEDTDGNGVAELSPCFALADLARLFGDVVGRRSVPVSIEADLVSGGRLRAELELTIVGGGPSLAARVEPNPSSRQSRLTFETRRAGPIKAMLFDMQGRLMSRLADDRFAPAGRHELRMDGQGAGGFSPPSGLYFYRVETAEGVASGRFVWIK